MKILVSFDGYLMGKQDDNYNMLNIRHFLFDGYLISGKILCDDAKMLNNMKKINRGNKQSLTKKFGNCRHHRGGRRDDLIGLIFTKVQNKIQQPVLLKMDVRIICDSHI